MSQTARQEVTTAAERAVATSAEPISIMEVIARAASDPSTDVDKLERLLGMAERIKANEAQTAFAKAMNECQASLRRVSADAHNPQTKSRYASYPALDRVVRPIYTRHGFSLSFSTIAGAPAEHIRLVCHVTHSSGHQVDHQVDMPADGKGAKGGDVMTKTHAVGAAMSYGQRYLLKLIFNIAVGDDDDGNSNGGRGLSEAAKAAIEEINACETATELVLWKKNNGQGAAVWKNVSDHENREIVALWNRRAAAMRGPDGDA